MKHIQASLHSIRKRVWRHKIALYHFDKAISKMEKAYLNASRQSDAIIFAIHEMKMYRIQEYWEYKNALSILKNYVVFTA